MANETAVVNPRVSEYPITIREGHLDLFGHVNNAVYLEIFEEARWDIVEAGGYGLRKVQETGVGPTILEIELQFKREIRNRERITVRTWLANRAGKVMTLRQVMMNEKGEEACTADFVIGLFDTRARKLIDPTPEWLRAVGVDI
jgi:acyl-CoA thioester hydrolase